jgi:hypothetical protein
MTNYTKLFLFLALIASALGAQRVVAPSQINSVSGNGRTLVTTTGTQTNGSVVCIDSAGNHVAGTCAASVTASINVQTGTSYTLVSGDNGKIITLNNASAITLTVPSGLGAGFNCLIVQLGAGAVTPTASSTTLHQRQSFTKTAGQYAVATLAAYVADTFVLGGDLQ